MTAGSPPYFSAGRSQVPIIPYKGNRPPYEATRLVREVEALRVLAHPMRQRIVRYLRQVGPATPTSLAKELSENSGIMSYHLRHLTDYGFVQEVTRRGQGSERWWQVAPKQLWIPRGGLSPEARAEARESGLWPMIWKTSSGTVRHAEPWASGAAGPGPSSGPG